MSLILKRLVLRNFMSFGNNESEIDLTFDGTTLINGENLDSGGANGVGKTTMANAISYALYNKPLSRGVSKEKLINRTNSAKNTSMEVMLEFERDGVNYEVHRSRGESYAIKIIKDYDYDNPITPDSVANADKAIAELVGISYELFRRTVVFLGSDVSFFEMKVSEQRLIIEELFKITELSKKADVLKTVISDTDKEIGITEVIIQQQEHAKTLRAKHIEEAEKRVVSWEDERISKITRLQKNLQNVDSVDLDQERGIHDAIKNAEKDRNNVRAKLQPVTEKYFSMQKELNSVITKDTELNNQIKKNTKEIAHLEHEKTCPYCKQEYADADKKIAELNLMNIAILNELDLLFKPMEDMTEKFTEVETEKLQLDAQLKLLEQEIRTFKARAVFQSFEEYTEAKNDSVKLRKAIQELETSDNPHLEALESLESEDDVVVDYDRLDALKSLQEHQKFMLKLLSDKNSHIRKKLINQWTPRLNERLFHYTKELGLPHVVKFNPDMSCDITEYGRELDYGNLSGGEGKRVNLALSLAFRDILQHLHNSVNMLIVDEVDGGSVDPIGIELTIRALKHKSREENIGIWIISHRPEMAGRFDREITITKENGFSRFGDFMLM